ncbi:hypothetical protein VNO78_13985 [Psophocarpus tetragonolobus]|uniref:Uncharacterized protein n=1 Tax=Psophocarpus tetragonolobus TaxID=3891 RepID=A0AAN9XPU8_PSOTE
MNRRTRPLIPHSFHKYLKPGSLARIRDSRIIARSHRLNALHRPPSPRPLPHPDQPQPLPLPTTTTTTPLDAPFPFFLASIYGPRCPQRKKLMAAKSVLILPAPDSSPDLVIDGLGSDLLLAN